MTMPDHTEREREARMALDSAYESAAVESHYDEDRYCDARNAYRNALLAARDAEWRAAVERVRRDVPDTIDGVCQLCGRYSSYCPCFEHNAALDALLREVPHDGQ